MFSIVATETSVLTFISIPGLSYRNNWFFLQLAFGYMLGRILVAKFLLPLYFNGEIFSIYEVIGNRFGKTMQKLSSGLFLVTRLLADGVRFLATAVLIQVITGWPIWVAVLVIGIVTMIYTLFGGIRTVIWVDSFQFILYLLGGLIIISFILYLDGFSSFDKLLHSNKLTVFKFHTNDIFKDSWYFLSAFIGGTLLSLSSHGADYMMVQRVLTCKNLKSARKAMIGSGIFVLIQFFIFLLVGSLIWVYMNGIEIDKDRELSNFIVNHLPIGIKGILLAGVLSAAMSTISSSINSLASSTIYDWFRFRPSLKISLYVSFAWSVLLILVALLFDEGDSTIVILGLKIASFTYGGMLSLFLISFSKNNYNTHNLIFGFICSIITVFILEWFSIAWTWFILSAVAVNLITVYFIHNINWTKITILGCILLFLGYYNYNKESYESGLDFLVKSDFDILKNKNIGLIANHTSVDNNGVHIIDKLIQDNINVISIFTPEHGLEGIVGAGEFISNGIEPKSGAKVYSLYGKVKKPTKDMLDDIDILLFDIQDIGVRYYTYISTLTYIIEAAAEHSISVVILDRLNPLGRSMQGPVLNNDFSSFVGMHPIPVRHGMTIGEIAIMINGENWIDSNNKAFIDVVKYEGLPVDANRRESFNPAPSPNMKNIETAWVYQGLCLLEGTNLSEGRGTDSPFLIFGAPWLNTERLYERIKDEQNKIKILEFTPIPSEINQFPKYANQRCKGIKIEFLENPLLWTIDVLKEIKSLHPEEFKFLESNFIDKLFGSDELRKYINASQINPDFVNKLDLDIKSFSKIRDKYLIY